MQLFLLLCDIHAHCVCMCVCLCVCVCVCVCLCMCMSVCVSSLPRVLPSLAMCKNIYYTQTPLSWRREKLTEAGTLDATDRLSFHS